MGAILGLFFFIIILVLVFGLSIIGGILRMIFGIGRKVTGQSARSDRDENYADNSGSQPKRKKIFDKEDGEYVDFEEVKEEK
ncbi:DUF4834 family protein [Bacteroides sedimenti]|uniref:DUF4834 domain-containing protein n=1 Tax=Bacteroides sedimenti TaxID=2136147 RepID=A0ABM8IFH3_9BACE